MRHALPGLVLRLASLAAIVLPISASAQRAGARAAGPKPKECVVLLTGREIRGVPSSMTTVKVAGTDQYNTFYGSGFDARCEGTDQRVQSDSAEHWGHDRKLVLIGHVHYTERRVKLDSDLMTYFTAEERLVADGNVAGVTNTGTRFRSPHAEYLRVARGIRERSRLVAEPRPDVWLSPVDAGPGARDSVHLLADRVISDNDSLLYARGRVVIERPDLVATADSAYMDNGKEIVRLSLTPKVVGRGERKFTLEGDLIDAYSKQRQVQRVKSSGHAKATSEDVTLTADSIDLRVAEQKLERAVAWGPKRAFAHSKDQDITADSIDVLMPGQVLREMHALRNAVAEGMPDSTKIISKERDWLRGDTIVARFDLAATADTSNRTRVRQIVATGVARRPASSHYQVAPGGVGKTDRPNLSYNTGRQITVDFRDGAVENILVSGQATGIYLEAVPDSVRRTPADSTGRKAASPVKPQGPRP